MGTVLIVCPACAKRIPKPSQFPLICSCGTRMDGTGETVNIKPPRWVRLLQRLSTPQDIGLGATAKRLASKFGGERFKRLTKKLGMPCKCGDREIEWNRLYPNPNYRSE